MGGMTRSTDPVAPGLAALAAMFADETRATFLLTLLDGRAWTAGELARHAHVAPRRPANTWASSSQAAYSPRTARADTATFGSRTPRRPTRRGPRRPGRPDTTRRPRTLREAGTGSAMARARTCYDHLAGRLGITLTDALTHRGLLRQDTGFALTDAGLRWFDEAGIDLNRTGRRPSRAAASTGPNAAPTSRAPPARPCAATPWTPTGAYVSARSARSRSRRTASGPSRNSWASNRRHSTDRPCPTAASESRERPAPYPT